LTWVIEGIPEFTEGTINDDVLGYLAKPVGIGAIHQGREVLEIDDLDHLAYGRLWGYHEIGPVPGEHLRDTCESRRGIAGITLGLCPAPDFLEGPTVEGITTINGQGDELEVVARDGKLGVVRGPGVVHHSFAGRDPEETLGTLDSQVNGVTQVRGSHIATIELPRDFVLEV
jgi:hypothetical protein